MSLSVGMVGPQRPQGEHGLKLEDLEEDKKMICLTHNDVICRNSGTAAAAGGAWPQA
jgi:hypothetical protein